MYALKYVYVISVVAELCHVLLSLHGVPSENIETQQSDHFVSIYCFRPSLRGVPGESRQSNNFVVFSCFRISLPRAPGGNTTM
jgi:hypothetical protein